MSADAASGTSQALLAAQGVTKRFPGVAVLKEVSFEVRRGEVHALCGENGAGKSTLIKLLGGIHPHGSYEGVLRVDGREARFSGVADAERAGIAVIYQELALVEELTVAENIFLGAEPRRHGLMDWARMWSEARQLLAQFGVPIEPDVPCRQLGVGQKQLVEIVKALRKRSRILILDEPTAALAGHEVQVLERIVRDLKARGIGCVYISHKLDEVFALADRITVLRDGAAVFTAEASATDRATVIRHMVGREIGDQLPRRTVLGAPREPALEVRGLSVLDPHTGAERLRGIAFAVAPGEVLGIGGLMGAGRTELLMHLFGAWGRRVSGEVRLDGERLPAGPPSLILGKGLALVSEDRRRYGLVLEQSISFNLSLSTLSRITRAGLVDRGAEYRRNGEMYASLRIRATGLEATAGKLSGGNQQKVVLGKALLTAPRVVLLDEPTRGIDIGAKHEIYELINRLTDEGRAVVLVSSEMPELIGMSDRILIMHEGRMAGEFSRAEATQEQLLRAALGPAAHTPGFA
jgi:D-xylose transport system ATP-binding protein